MRWVSIFASCVLLFWPGLAHSEPLKPTSKWVINFADNQCMAMRAFGTEEEPLHFALKSSPTSDVIQISLVRNGAKVDAAQDVGRLTFDSGQTVKMKQLRYSSGKTVVRRINLGAAEAKLLAQSSSLDWTILGQSHELALGSMASVMKVMSQCRDDLRKYWNIDPKGAASVREPAKSVTPLISAFKSGDYPWQAVRNDESGTTGLILLIDDKGKLADCMIDQTSNVATLDAMACHVIQERVKFAPAIGADGKPVRSALTQRIRWQMPGGSKLPRK